MSERKKILKSLKEIKMSKLQTNGYDVEYDFDKNSMLIHAVFKDIEERWAVVFRYDNEWRGEYVRKIKRINIKKERNEINHFFLFLSITVISHAIQKNS